VAFLSGELVVNSPEFVGRSVDPLHVD
jgi:hypothetical protein